MSNINNDDVTFEIIEHIGVIASFPTGWKKEINIVSWNGGPAKYDIREWDPSHYRMTKGITLKENEMRLLLEVMRRRRWPSQFQDQVQSTRTSAAQANISATSSDAAQSAAVVAETATKSGNTSQGASISTLGAMTSATKAKGPADPQQCNAET